MEPLNTEYRSMSQPQDSSEIETSNRRTKTFAILAILAVAICTIVYIPHASGTFDLRVFVSRAPDQPMNGFFTFDLDQEICVQLARNNEQFESVRLFGMAPDFIRSIRGRLSPTNNPEANSVTIEASSKSDTAKNCALDALANSFSYTCQGKTFSFTRVPACVSGRQKRIQVDLDAVNRIKVTPQMKNNLEGEWDFYSEGMAKVFIGSATITHSSGNGNSFRVTWHGMLRKIFQTCESKFIQKRGGILFAKMYGRQVDFRWELLGRNRMRTENPDFSSIALVGIRRNKQDL